MGARWRIYYADGSTYSDRDGTAFWAPSTGVQAIALGDGTLTHSKDAFYWTADGWHGCDQMGLYDYLMNHRGPKAVLFGRTVRNEAFWQTVKRAQVEGVA